MWRQPGISGRKASSCPAVGCAFIPVLLEQFRQPCEIDCHLSRLVQSQEAGVSCNVWVGSTRRTRRVAAHRRPRRRIRSGSRRYATAPGSDRPWTMFRPEEVTFSAQSWALATSNPAQSNGGKHAYPRSSNRPRHPDIPQSDDKRDAGKYIQGTHRNLRRDAASLSAMISFSRIV